MNVELSAIVWLIVAGAAGFLTYWSVSLGIKILDVRARELRHSLRCLVEYEEASGRVFSDPATPASVRTLLSAFDEGVNDPKIGWFLALSFIWDRTKWFRLEDKGAEWNEVWDDLDRLRDHRCDLYQNAINAIAAGYTATMLRNWFSGRVVRLILVDPRHDPVTPARVVACGHKAQAA